MDIKSVTCPITGVEFRCIHHDIEEDIEHLEKWSSDIQNRMNEGENITVAYDAEGYNLGTSYNSGICVQIAEIFGNNYNVEYSKGRCPNINTRPGVIVFFPFSDRIKKCLERIFNDKRIRIITFDCVNDLAVLIEEGVRMNFRNIIDCQTGYGCRNKSEIKNIKVMGIKKVIEKAKENVDPIMKNVRELGGKDVINSQWLMKNFLNMLQQMLPSQHLHVFL